MSDTRTADARLGDIRGRGTPHLQRLWKGGAAGNLPVAPPERQEKRMTAPDMFSFIDWNDDPCVMNVEKDRACDLMRVRGAVFLMAKKSSNPRGLDIAGWLVKPDPEPADFDPPRVAAGSDEGGGVPVSDDDDFDYDYPSTDLRPCPFCGGKAEFGVIEKKRHPDHGGHFIQCTNTRCEASSALRFACGEDPKPLLAEQWNRRVTPRGDGA